MAHTMAPRPGRVLRRRSAVACFIGSIGANVSGPFWSNHSPFPAEDFLSVGFYVLPVVLLGPAVALLGLRLSPHRSGALAYLGAIAWLLCSVVAYIAALGLVGVGVFSLLLVLAFTGLSQEFLLTLLSVLVGFAIGVLTFRELSIGATLMRSAGSDVPGGGQCGAVVVAPLVAIPLILVACAQLVRLFIRSRSK
jgi:hypothetical protein